MRRIGTDRALSLFEISYLFFILGCTCFGGMWAAMDRLQQELVERRGILTAEDQRSLMLAAAIIPAPKFLAFAAMIGYRVGGISGAIMSSFFILLPGAVLVLLGCVVTVVASDNEALKTIQHFVGLGVVGLLGGNAVRMFGGRLTNKISLAIGILISLGIPVYVIVFEGSLIASACLALAAGSLLLRDISVEEVRRGE